MSKMKLQNLKMKKKIDLFQQKEKNACQLEMENLMNWKVFSIKKTFSFLSIKFVQKQERKRFIEIEYIDFVLFYKWIFKRTDSETIFFSSNMPK